MAGRSGTLARPRWPGIQRIKKRCDALRVKRYRVLGAQHWGNGKSGQAKPITSNDDCFRQSNDMWGTHETFVGQQRNTRVLLLQTACCVRYWQEEGGK